MRRVNTSATSLGVVEAAGPEDFSENHRASKDVGCEKFDQEKPVERTFEIFEDSESRVTITGQSVDEFECSGNVDTPVDIPEGRTVTDNSIEETQMSTSLCETTTPNTSRTSTRTNVTQSNLFSHLSVFFHEDCAATPGVGMTDSHPIEPADDYRILPGLLEDMLRRGLYTLPGLVAQLRGYLGGCDDVAESSLLTSDDSATSSQAPLSPSRLASQRPPCFEQQREFIVALYLAAHAPGHSRHQRDHDLELAHDDLLKLLWSTPGAFKRLFWSVLTGTQQNSTTTPSSKRNYPSSKDFGLALLDNFLVKAPRVIKDPSNPVVDEPLTFGPTPLVVACRHVNTRAVLLLLRHGASMKTTWMSYKTALQVLLFSPNVVHLEDSNRSNLELCLEYFTRAFPSLNVPALDEISSTGYHPLHENWRDLVRDYRKGPARLQHLSRCAVREALRHSGQLSEGARKLPLPSLLVGYVDLQH